MLIIHFSISNNTVSYSRFTTAYTQKKIFPNRVLWEKNQHIANRISLAGHKTHK